MKKRMSFAIKAVVFLTILSFVVCFVNRILTLKTIHSTGPTTESFQSFYQMEPDTVDVLFLGSSHTACGFDPQELYNHSGITSYNLGNNSQPVWLSYYWLKEALKYQSPKAVVLDCYFLFMDGKTENREALDDMHWGTVKWQAVNTVCRYNENLSRLSYFFPNIRFHGRWEDDLKERDFVWGESIKTPARLKGFFINGVKKCGYQDFIPFEVQDSDKEGFQPEAEEYLDKIVELCRDNNIELVLIKTPTLSETVERYNTIADYAKEHQLKFYDFNEKNLYEEIGFDYANDMNDSSTQEGKNAHANFVGAKKMTWYVGDILQSEYGIEGRTDWQWADTEKFHEGIWRNFYLRNENNLSEYLFLLKDERYTIFMATAEDDAISAETELITKLNELGLSADMSYSYFSVIEGRQVILEKNGDELLEQTGSFRGGQVVYEIMSAGSGYGSKCSIKIDRGERAAALKQGLNIVVYDNELKMVVDSVCFDTNQSEPQVIR